jgi:hypothetical protein
MVNHDPKYNVDRDRDHDNDNGVHKREDKPIVPASKGGMLASASLTALEAVFNSVDTGFIIGGSAMPLLQFKRDGNGTWTAGRKRDVVEDGSRWATNPRSFSRGYVYFDANNKPHDRMVPINQPMPDVTTLPDTGYEWQEQWSVNMKCVSGIDAGIEVVYKANTVGGRQAIVGLVAAIRDRFAGGMHDGKVAPIVQLAKDSYQHGQYGRVYTPVLTIVEWMSPDDPDDPAKETAPVAPLPSAPASSTEQPRKRRVS